MEIDNWPSCKTIAPLYKGIKELDLLENIAELEACGYTILKPEQVGSDQTLRLQIITIERSYSYLN